MSFVSSFILHPSALLFAARQPLVEVLAADAEDARGLRLVAARGGQRLADVLVLHLGERRAARAPRRGPDGRPHGLGQVFSLDARALGDDDGALDDVRQLATCRTRVSCERAAPARRSNPQAPPCLAAYFFKNFRANRRNVSRRSRKRRHDASEFSR